MNSPEDSCWADDKTTGDRQIEWEILRKTVTVWVDDDDLDKQVGEDDPDFRNYVYVDGVIDGCEILYIVSCNHPECKGTYDVNVTGDTKQGNYEVSFQKGEFIIEATEIPRPTVKTGLVYDGNYHYGIESGDGFNLTGENYEKESNELGQKYEVTVTLKVGYQWDQNPTEREYIETWAIDKKKLTVKPTIPMSKAHGEDDPLSYNASIPEPETVGSDTISYTTWRQQGEIVGKYTIYVSGTEIQGNYLIEFYNGPEMFSIIANEVSIPAKRENLTYNGHTQVGVPEGAGYTLSGTSVAINASEYTVTATPNEGFVWEGGGNAPVPITWTIAQKPVDVKVENRVIKPVGGADPENYDASVVVIGTLNNDPISFTTSRAQGEIIGKYMITVTGSASQGNYSVTFHPDTEYKFYIEGEKIDRPVARTGLTYNGQEQTGVAHHHNAYEITGNKATDATRGDDHHVAVVTINVGFEWTTNPSNRDTFEIEWDIAPLTIEVRSNQQLSKYVGGMDPDFNESVTVHGLVDDYNITYQASCVHAEAIGHYNITVTGNEEQGNYHVVYKDGEHMFMIDGIVITEPVPVTVYYDSTTKTGVLPGDGYTITGNTGINATRGTPNIAHAVIQVGYEWATHPGLRSELPIEWKIYPATLVARADSQAVKEGNPAKPFTVSFYGFCGNDDVSVITVNSPTFDCDYTVESGSGEYIITLSGTFEAANYDFLLEDGILLCGKNVIDKPQAVDGLIYTGEEQIGVATAVGYIVTDERATAAGNYIAIVTPDEDYVWSDATSGPFDLPWTIMRAGLTITADDQEVDVGDPAKTFTVTAEGFVHGEGMEDLHGTLTIECSYTTSSPAGTYPIVPSGVSSDNYEIVFQNGTLTASNHEPRPKPVPPVITVSVTIQSSSGGHTSVDMLKVPLNSKVTVNGDVLIIGSGSSAKIVRAIADDGYAFDSWSIGDDRILHDMNITASFKKIDITAIDVKESPDKVTYNEGENFDPEGLTILVTFSDGSQAIVEYEGNETKFSFDPSLNTPLKADDNRIVVTYGGHSTEMSIKVYGPNKEPFPWWIILVIVTILLVAIVVYRHRKQA